MFTGHATRWKAGSGYGSNFSSHIRIEKLVLSGACAPSYQEDRDLLAMTAVCRTFFSQHWVPQMSTVRI
jgi:hypothetical protein